MFLRLKSHNSSCKEVTPELLEIERLRTQLSYSRSVQAEQTDHAAELSCFPPAVELRYFSLTAKLSCFPPVAKLRCFSPAIVCRRIRRIILPAELRCFPPVADFSCFSPVAELSSFSPSIVCRLSRLC
ncbi:hypothetical protein TNCV_1151151 [Trichonephila clavipes]|nr:hypothetical protein TNCV_1151151 [Trichonephila clavipes]